MAVSISVDEPEIDIRVTGYEGYTEASGVRVPVNVGDVQVQKGAASVAGGLTVPVAVGDAQSAKGAQSAAQGLTVGVSVEATSQKGNASVADGVSAQTSVGDAESQKGDGTQAQGLSVPVVLGGVVMEGPWNPPWRPQDRPLSDFTAANLGYDLEPWFYLNFAEHDYIPKRIRDGWQRGTEATYWDVNEIRTAAPHEPRLQTDPETGERYLLAEPQRTNLLLNSQSLSGQSVAVSSATYSLSFRGGGTLTLSGAHSATVEGTAGERTTYTFTPASGTLSVGVSGTVEYAQLEEGAFATSWIKTDGSITTRAPDNLSNLPIGMEAGAKSVYFRVGQEAGAYAPNEGGNVTNAELNLTDAPGAAGSGLLRPSTGLVGVAASGEIRDVVNTSDEDLQGNATSDGVDRLTIQPDKDPSTDGAIYRIKEIVAWEEERSYGERRSLVGEIPQPFLDLDGYSRSTLNDPEPWATLGISEPPHFHIDIPRYGVPAKMRSAWTRDTQATYWDENGVLQTAQAGEPRVQHDPVTGDVRGVIAEPQKQNSIDSRQPNGGSWNVFGDSADLNFTTGKTGIENGSGATLIEDTNGSSSNGPSYIYTFSNDFSNAFTFSIFVKKDSNDSRVPRIDLDLETGSRQRQSCMFSTVDGAGVNDGQGDGTFEVLDRGGWWKVVLSVNNGEPGVADNKYGNTRARIRIFPARESGLSAGDQATGSIIVDAPQLERHNPLPTDGSGGLARTYHTMPILGGGTRGRDDLILPFPFVSNAVGGYYEVAQQGAAFGSIPRGNTTSNGWKFSFVNATDNYNYVSGLTEQNYGVPGGGVYVSGANAEGNFAKAANNTDHGRDGGEVNRLYLQPDRKPNHPAGFTFTLRRMYLWPQKLTVGSDGQLKALFDHDFSV